MEEQHKSKIVWVLFTIIVALVGLNIYQYYIANNIEEEVVTEVAVVETSTTPVTTTSVSTTQTTNIANNWLEDSKITVDTLVSSDTYSDPVLSNVTAITLSPGENQLNSVDLQQLRTASLNNYMLCIDNYSKTHPNEYYPGAGNIMDGMQTHATDHSIGTPIRDGDLVKVPVTINGSTPYPKVYIYTLKFENDKWLVDSSTKLEEFIATDQHCSK